MKINNAMISRKRAYAGTAVILRAPSAMNNPTASGKRPYADTARIPQAWSATS